MKINDFAQVDIVIPTFNSASNIELCLKRLISQEYEGKTSAYMIKSPIFIYSSVMSYYVKES